MSRIYSTAEDAADVIEELEEDLLLENLIGDCEDKTQLSSDDYESGSDVLDGEEDEAATLVARRRAPAFSKRLVHDINSALDEDNYSMLQLAYNNAEVYTTALNRWNDEIPEITWTSTPPSSGRQPGSAVILGEPGVTGMTKEAKDRLQCWDLFFSAHVINLLLNYTNEKIATARRSSSFNYCFYSTDPVEIVGLIGLVYLRNLLSEVESRTQGSRPRTQKKSEAKDSPSKDKPSRGHGQECSRPRPRTQAQVLSKIKVFKTFFGRSQKKRLQKNFWGAPRIFNNSENTAVLEPKTGQFLRTWGFEAKDFKMCP